MASEAVPSGLGADDRETVERFHQAGQGHVFRFWSGLSREERAALLEDARGVDLDLVDRLLADVLSAATTVPELAPIEPIGPDAPDRAEAEEAGRQLFRDGRVAFYTVAGGQGTRLGFPGPKGCFPVGPVSGKTLFRWHAEKVLAAS
ncbi:MAG: UTP--glucose-1-phosphate uridylyltransferase, partial [Planctomycetota bacterium]